VSPSLTSSYAGSIDSILFAFPRYATGAALGAGYKSVIAALRHGRSSLSCTRRRCARRSMRGSPPRAIPSATVTFVELPDYVNFTDWAEDGYVSLAANGVSFLMEPWEFPRSGDTLIAEAVQSVTGIKTGQAPLIFQGGNCLIGDDFWLLGKDYFADSVRLAGEQGRPRLGSAGTAPDAFVAQLFSEFVDTDRRLIVVGTNKPIPLRSFYGTREGSRYFLDIASDGAGTFQPIFHIDMLITLVGMGAARSRCSSAARVG
jgi:hypothetical protein